METGISKNQASAPKVLVFGATGALGLPVVRELLSRGYEVTGTTRSAEKVAQLEELGARGLVVDALDAESVRRAVEQVHPAYVVDLLTAFPDAGPVKPSDMVATNQLRIQGTANLLQAAMAAGVQRIVAESYFAVYGYGNHGEEPLPESAPLPPQSTYKGLHASVDAMRSMEEQLLEANNTGKIEAVILRFGAIYGPDNPGTRALLGLLRKRRMPLIKGAAGLTPFLHTEDAARAIAAAIEQARSGAIYNIADDTRGSFNEFLRTAAQAIGAPTPPAFPRWLVGLLAPAGVATATSKLPISNELAKRELGWKPGFPDYHEGLRQVARELQTSQAAPQSVKKHSLHQAS
jgi:nucleoside-diphosphate-sugar epimerase